MFEPNFDKILKLQKEFLKQIASDIDLLAATVARDAARMSRTLMKELGDSKLMRETMDRVRSYVTNGFKHTGKAAATAFKQAFQRTMSATREIVGTLENALGELEARSRKLSERMTGGWDKAAENARMYENAVKQINEQLVMNNQLEQKLQGRLAGVNRLKGMTKKEKQALSNEIQAEIDRVKELNTELVAARNNAKDIGAQTRILDIKEKFQGWREAVLGAFDINKIKPQLGFIKDFAGALLKSPRMMLTAGLFGVAAVLKMIFGDLMSGLKTFRDSGLSATQSLSSVIQSTHAVTAAAAHGVALSQEEAAKSTIELQKEFGRLTLPQGIVNTTALLNRTFKLAGGEAAKLFGVFMRFNGSNVKESLESVERAKQIAYQMDANVGETFRLMAEHSDDLARSGNMSATAFEKAAIHSQRLKFNLGSISGMADRLVSDFEGALVSAAKIQVIAPGANMSEVMYASQFGSLNDIIHATKDMIDQMPNLTNLPRSLKLQLSEATGISVSDMLKLQKGELTEGEVRKRMEDSENFRTNLLDILTGDKGIIGYLRAILLALPTYWAGKAAQFVLSGGAKVDYSGMGEDKATDFKTGDVGAEQLRRSGSWSLHHKGGMAGITDTRRVIEEIPRLHTGFMPDEIPAILQRGEAVLTRNMLNNLGEMMQSVDTLRNLSVESPSASPVKNVELFHRTMASDATAQTQRSNNDEHDATNSTPSTDMKPVIDILNRILLATERGHIVKMDGKTVGHTITDAFSRG